MAWLSKIGAWIYPGAPACNANVEIADGRVIYMLKPQYYQVDPGGAGTLTQLTVGGAGCNGYSVANANLIKQYSSKQFTTISCGTGANMDALCSDGTKRTNAINTLITFLNLTGFTGVELDWEGYSGWTAGQYTNFKTFVSALATSLHSNGYQLMIDGPPITAAVDSVNGQNLYQFKYEDFLTTADYLVCLSYDKQYDYGAGTPIAPTAFVQLTCDWMIAKVIDLNKIVIGMPSYGYTGSDALYNINIKTYDQLSPTTGFGTATRDAGSYEMNWQNTPSKNATGSLSNGATSCTLASSWTLASGSYTVTFSNGNVRVATLTNGATTCTFSALSSGATSTLTWTAVDNWYQDTSGMNSKRTAIEAKGIKNISVWHIGGNQWFTGTEPTSPASLTDVATALNLKTLII